MGQGEIEVKVEVEKKEDENRVSRSEGGDSVSEDSGQCVGGKDSVTKGLWDGGTKRLREAGRMEDNVSELESRA